MLNFKDNENNVVFDEKSENKIKFQKIKCTFFGQHRLVEKSPTATDIYIYISDYK